MTTKFIFLVATMILGGLAVWLFFWPLVLCYYDLSLLPLLEASLQMKIGFIVGFFVFIGAVFTGKNVVI